MSNWIEWFEAPYAENDDLMNDWVETILHRVSWELFHHQHDIVKMAYETENGIPVLKDEAIEIIDQVITSELGWLRSYMIGRILVSYAKENIDLGEEGRWYMNDQFDPEDAADFWKEIDEYIWQDYAKVLGNEKTAELWKKWGKAPLED